MSPNSWRPREWGEIEDLLLEVRANRNGGSAIKGEKCAIAALALCSEDAPIELIAELIESREVCYSAHRKARERLPELKKAVEADPTDAQKIADLGFGLNALDEDEAALSALTSALAHAETMSIGTTRDCLNSLGWIHFVRGQYEDALGWLGLALGLSQIRETPDEEDHPDEGAAFELTYRLALENMLVTLAKVGHLTEATAPLEEYHNCFGRLPDCESRSLTGLGLKPDVIFIGSNIRRLSAEGSTSEQLPFHFKPRDFRNRWAREYLTALERSNRRGLEDLPELAARSGMEDFEDPLVELRFLRQSESPLKALRLAIAALACCNDEAPNALVAELIETIETCYWKVEAIREELPKMKAALEEGPPDSEKVARLGFALNALDEDEAALAAFTKALEHPDTMSYYAHRDCLNNIGWNHYLRGEYEEALGWFEHACRLADSSQQVGAKQEVAAQEAADNGPYKLALENMLLALARLGRIREAAIRLEEYHDCFGRLPKRPARCRRRRRRLGMTRVQADLSPSRKRESKRWATR
jgi:tetratricopeptide (TPR) repeat protein